MTRFTLYAIIFFSLIITLFSCCKENETPCNSGDLPRKDYYISSGDRAKVPYSGNENFKFLYNGTDTIYFTGTGVDTVTTEWTGDIACERNEVSIEHDLRLRYNNNLSDDPLQITFDYQLGLGESSMLRVKYQHNFQAPFYKVGDLYYVDIDSMVIGNKMYYDIIQMGAIGVPGQYILFTKKDGIIKMVIEAGVLERIEN